MCAVTQGPGTWWVVGDGSNAGLMPGVGEDLERREITMQKATESLKKMGPGDL